MPATTIEPGVRDDAANLKQLQTVRRCSACSDIMFWTPVLECGHCGRIHPIRCFSYKSHDHFYAECLDLDLISRGQTEEEAVAHLQQMMYTYLNVAFSGDTKGLILRPAPFSSWLRYYSRFWLHWLKYRLLRGHLHHKDFTRAEVVTLSRCD